MGLPCGVWAARVGPRLLAFGECGEVGQPFAVTRRSSAASAGHDSNVA